MSGLPHGLTDPLHIDEPFPIWTLLLGALAVWLLYRLLRALAKRRAPGAASASATPPVTVPDTGIGSVIEAIRRRAREREAYRSGCHELAATLKGYFGRRLTGGDSIEHMTAAEIARRVGDNAVSRYFGLLSRLQFFRAPPTARDFDAACDLALEVVVGATGPSSAGAAPGSGRAPATREGGS